MKDENKTKKQLIEELNQMRQQTAVLKKEKKNHERIEKELRENEERYQQFFELSPDMIAINSERGREISFANPAAAKLFGVKNPQQVIGKPISDFIHPDYFNSQKENIRMVRDGKRIFLPEHKFTRIDGTIFYLKTAVVPIIYKGGRAAMVISQDVTERKRSEEVLKKLNQALLEEHEQRKLLSKKLIELLEHDHQQTARELHDHIGQSLTTLKMDLEIISGKLRTNDKDLRKSVKNAIDKTIYCIKDVKNIVYGLRPTTLDTLGLISALRELFNDIKNYKDIDIHFFTKNIPKQIDHKKEIAVYRITQEALNNVIKHAQAKNVFVNLIKKDGLISLSIEDDGIGFLQKKMMISPKNKESIGLFIMQERVVLLGGSLSVESQIGQGTHLLAELPL